MPAAKKDTKKAAPAKAEPKKAEPKKEAVKEEPVVVDTKKKPTSYHVSKHPSGKWQVKGTGAEKAIKLYDTQAEAIAAAKIIAENQDSSIRVHSKKGKIRKA